MTDWPVRKHMILLLAIAAFYIASYKTHAQWNSMLNPPQPSFKYARNMSIISMQRSYAAGIASLNIQDTTYLMQPYNMTTKIVLYTLSNVGHLAEYGSIKCTDAEKLSDVCYMKYTADSANIFFAMKVANQNKSKMVSIPFTMVNRQRISNAGSAGVEYADLIGDTAIDIANVNDIEQMMQIDGKLFIASNDSILRYYDVTSGAIVADSSIVIVPNAPTKHSEPLKIHEVNGYVASSGKRIIGLGMPRYGMCVITFNNDANWSIDTIQYQYYEFDRTTFPDTIINPQKYIYDTTFVADSSSERNHKWDYNMCHSVVPYPGFIITTDELTVNATDTVDCELLDFYQPNESGENDDHRLNYLHRNRPGMTGIDPHKFEGSFLRIWDASKIFKNDTALINNSGAIVNAYDVQEEGGSPEGYVGILAVADTCFVPTGIHEPVLVGNRLYLGGYNTGARVLDINNSDIRVRAYCRTEEYLCDDSTSENYYGRRLAYAKGIYRLIPADSNSNVLFGSDLNNGVWVFRMYDTTLTGQIPCCDSIQPVIEIGTVELDHPMTFHISDTLTIPPCDSVCFVDSTTFISESNATITIEGKLSLKATTFVDSVTFLVKCGGALTVLPGTNLVLNAGQEISIDSGTVEIPSGASLTLNGGIVRCSAGGYMTIGDPTGLKGSGTFVSANIHWKLGFHTWSDQMFVFQGGGTFLFECDTATAPHYLINRGYMEFQGSTNPYVFGDCLDEVRNVDSSVFITQKGATLQNLSGMLTWNTATIESNGTVDSACVWLFRQDEGLDNYTSLTARYTTFGGSTLHGGRDAWFGILNGTINSLLDLENCIIQDVYIDTLLNCTAIHFYESRNFNSRIVKCTILRPDTGQIKLGNAILLQPGSYWSYTRLECSRIDSQWFTGIASVNSDAHVIGNTITANGFAAGLSAMSEVVMRRNCMENHVFGGVKIDASNLFCYDGSGAGNNRFVQNANWQLCVCNGSSLFAGDCLTGLWRGHDNNISHSDTVLRVYVDNSLAYLQRNWYGITPDIDLGNGWCEYTPDQWSLMFNRPPDTSPFEVHCASILDYCWTGCDDMLLGGFPTSQKTGGLAQYASSIDELREYARAGNFAEVYRFIGALITGNASHVDARLAAMVLFQLEHEHVRNYPDSLAASRSRMTSFLLSKISMATLSETQAALLNVLARALYAFEDVQGADSRISQLRNQYPSSSYSRDILPILQLVAMAQCDSAKMNAAIAAMQSSGCSLSDLHLARSLRSGYMRYRLRVPAPKYAVYDTTAGTRETSSQIHARCYPNPFNPSTIIEYTVPQEGRVTLRVYSLLGREVACLVDEEQSAGVHSAVFEAGSGDMSGMYFYILTTETGTLTGRMSLLR